MGGFLPWSRRRGIDAGISALAGRFGPQPGPAGLFIPVTMIVFSLGGAVFGMCEEAMPFVLVFVPLACPWATTGSWARHPVHRAAAGFAGAFFNPFTVGIAQGIAGLPLYSGLAYRLIVWAIGTTIAIVFVTRYASRVRKDFKKSLNYEEDAEFRLAAQAKADPGERKPVTAAHKAVLLLSCPHGPAGRGHPQIQVVTSTRSPGLFLALGILAGLIGRLKSDDIGPGLRRRGQGHGQHGLHHRHRPGPASSWPRTGGSWTPCSTRGPLDRPRPPVFSPS